MDSVDVEKEVTFIKLHALAVVTIKLSMFLGVEFYSTLDTYQRFGITCCLNFKRTGTLR